MASVLGKPCLQYSIDRRNTRRGGYRRRCCMDSGYVRGRHNRRPSKLARCRRHSCFKFLWKWLKLSRMPKKASKRIISRLHAVRIWDKLVGQIYYKQTKELNQWTKKNSWKEELKSIRRRRIIFKLKERRRLAQWTKKNKVQTNYRVRQNFRKKRREKGEDFEIARIRAWRNWAAAPQLR